MASVLAAFAGSFLHFHSIIIAKWAKTVNR